MTGLSSGQSRLLKPSIFRRLISCPSHRRSRGTDGEYLNNCFIDYCEILCPQEHEAQLFKVIHQHIFNPPPPASNNFPAHQIQTRALFAPTHRANVLAALAELRTGAASQTPAVRGFGLSGLTFITAPLRTGSDTRRLHAAGLQDETSELNRCRGRSPSDEEEQTKLNENTSAFIWKLSLHENNGIKVIY